MKFISSLSILPLLVIFLSSCQDYDGLNDPDPDALESTGILGKWEIQNRIIGTIDDMAVDCCEFLEFTTDSITQDLIGGFQAYGYGYHQVGTFEIDIQLGQITVNYDNKERAFQYEADGDQLLIEYESDGKDVDEYYIRRDQ